MTLDGTIKNLTQTAKTLHMTGDISGNDDFHEYAIEQMTIVGWLKELKQYRESNSKPSINSDKLVSVKTVLEELLDTAIEGEVYGSDDYVLQQLKLLPKTVDKPVNSGIVEIKPTETYVEHDIVVDGVKVGTVELEPKTKMITRLNIESAYQDKGYGTKVVNYLASQGYNNLWVNADNDRAIHVYEKCGFKLIKPTMFLMESEHKE